MDFRIVTNRILVAVMVYHQGFSKSGSTAMTYQKAEGTHWFINRNMVRAE